MIAYIVVCYILWGLGLGLWWKELWKNYVAIGAAVAFVAAPFMLPVVLLFAIGWYIRELLNHQLK